MSVVWLSTMTFPVGMYDQIILWGYFGLYLLHCPFFVHNPLDSKEASTSGTGSLCGQMAVCSKHESTCLQTGRSGLLS